MHTPQLQHNVSLKTYNTFGINVNCKTFVEFTSEESLSHVLDEYVTSPQDVYVLGGGSNVLLTKDYEGLILKNSIKGIEVIEETTEEVWVKVGAGEVWHEFVLYAIEQEWYGIENMSLIPGTVGAAPMQNIGAYGVEIKNVFHSLEAVFYTGEKKSFENDACQFGYRESIFKKELKQKCIITSVTFRLSKVKSFNTTYGAIQETLAAKGIKELSLKAVSDAVISIRQSKLPDPKEIGNAGSFFKNPVISNEEFQSLVNNFPQVPYYPAGEGFTKIPAGWLIEQAGWKGKTIDNIGVHKKQALVLVNYGGGSGHEIYNLALQIKADVKEKFNVDISPEVNVL